MTHKLYLTADPPMDGTATVLDVGETDGRAWVRLDRTPFHAQGGGQKADRGRIGPATVVHVVHAEGGEVLHVVEDASGLVVGESVEVSVDADWRGVCARSHTAGHLIAALVEARYPELTAVSGHHWPGQSRVEFSGPRPESAEVNEHLVADLAAAIAAALPVAVEGDPQTDRRIRIGEHPAVPCGGTHLAHLGELGEVTIARVRAKSGKLRISYTTT